MLCLIIIEVGKFKSPSPSWNQTYTSWNSWTVFRHLVRNPESPFPPNFSSSRRKKEHRSKSKHLLHVFIFLKIPPAVSTTCSIFSPSLLPPEWRIEVVDRQWVPLFWSTHFVFLLSPAIASPAISVLPVARMFLLFPRPLVAQLLHVAVPVVPALSLALAAWTPSCPVPRR